MTISRTNILAELESFNTDAEKPIPEHKLAYFRERQRNRLYDFVLGKFLENERENNLTKTRIARRLNKDAAQINRWLASPSNWTIDTLSDLMLAIGRSEIKFAESPLISHHKNYHPDSIRVDIKPSVTKSAKAVTSSLVRVPVKISTGAEYRNV